MNKNKSRILAAMIACLMLIVVFAVPAFAEGKTADSLYITAINEKVATGSGTVFTKDFNDTNKIGIKEGNFDWAAYVTAKPTATEGVYEVVSENTALPNTLESISIPEGGFIYTAHTDTDSESDVYEKSLANSKVTDALIVGDKITLIGVDLANETKTADAKISLGEVKVDTSSVESEPVSEVSDLSEDESSTPAAESEDDTSSVTKADDSSNDNVSKDDDDGLSTPVIIALCVGGVILLAVITYAATRKKK